MRVGDVAEQKKALPEGCCKRTGLILTDVETDRLVSAAWHRPPPPIADVAREAGGIAADWLAPHRIGERVFSIVAEVNGWSWCPTKASATRSTDTLDGARDRR